MPKRDDELLTEFKGREISPDLLAANEWYDADSGIEKPINSKDPIVWMKSGSPIGASSNCITLRIFLYLDSDNKITNITKAVYQTFNYRSLDEIGTDFYGKDYDASFELIRSILKTEN